MSQYKGIKLIDGNVIIRDKTGRPLFDLSTFIPSQSLVESVNFAFHQRAPLLITGERSRRDLVANAVAYELYGNDFLSHYVRWMVPRNASFSDGFYTYEHERRKRDLEYHRLAPESNPIKEAEHYFQEGPMLKMWKKLSEYCEHTPILEIRNVHQADENFILDLMDFLLFSSEVKIPELDTVVKKEQTAVPFIIMTAEEGFQLPKNYNGVVYTHALVDLQKEIFLKEIFTGVGSWLNLEKTPLTEDGYHDESKAAYIRDEPKFPEFKVLIEKLVDLYYLIKDSSLLQPGNAMFPMSVFELRNTINYKAVKVLIQGESAEKEIAAIEKLIESQYELAQSADLGDVVKKIRAAIEDAELNDAMKSLELIKNQLPKELHNEAIQLVSRYHDLSRSEMMGTESSLLLFPQKNKLTFDLLAFLDKV